MPPAAPPLVGRDAELSALADAVERAAGGAPFAVMLTGEPGVGKSRLLQALGDMAAARGMRVLAGRAGELERDLTLAVVRDALGPLLADAVEALDAAAGSGERHRLAREVRSRLEGAAGERPVAVLIDDAHWADPASVDVLALLLQRPPQAPSLIALATRTGRSGPLEEMAAAGEIDGTGRVLELSPLTEEAVAALLPDMPRAARRRLHRESGGNPFYLEQLARAAEGDDRGSSVPAIVGVPRSVRAALAREIGVLPPRARRVLEGAAVAGDPFDPAIAAVAADLPEDAVLSELDLLLAADVVRPAGRPRAFRFRHPLVRRAVYDGAGGGWRLGAHGRVAAALARDGASAAQRAHHVERAARAGDLGAVDVLAAAAGEVKRTAPATAAGWLEAALRLVPAGEAHAGRRIRLLEARADALVLAGHPAEASDALRGLLDELPPDTGATRARVVEALSELEALWLQRPVDARRLIDAEAALLGSDPGVRAILAYARVDAGADVEGHPEAAHRAAVARDAAREAGDRQLEALAAVVHADRSSCALREDDPDARARVDRSIREAGALVDALPDEEVAGRLQMVFWLGVARLFRGDARAARAAAERGVAVGRRTGQGMVAASCRALSAFADQELGELDAAEATVDEVLDGALVSGNPQLAYWSALVAAWIELARGRPERALAHARTGWDTAGVVGWSQVGWTAAEAELALGDPHRALAVLETFGGVNAKLWPLDRLKAVDVLVRALIAAGRVQDAEPWARRAPAEVGGREDGVNGAIAAHARAAFLLATADPSAAAEVALAGAARADEGGAALWAGRCRTLAGEGLAAAGRRHDARASLRRAAADLEARGAWGYRDAALRALRRLGDRPRVAAADRTTAGDVLSGLTAREREVAVLVGDGLTNAQVAARLHLSESTIEKHVSRVLAKLGEPTRAGVVRRLAEGRPAT